METMAFDRCESFFHPHSITPVEKLVLSHWCPGTIWCLKSKERSRCGDEGVGWEVVLEGHYHTAVTCWVRDIILALSALVYMQGMMKLMNLVPLAAVPLVTLVEHATWACGLNLASMSSSPRWQQLQKAMHTSMKTAMSNAFVRSRWCWRALIWWLGLFWPGRSWIHINYYVCILIKTYPEFIL